MWVAFSARSLSAAPAGPPLDVYAILTTTGTGAFFGQAEAKALTVLESQLNATGGIGGRPVHFNVLDDQGNPQVTVQLVSDLIAKNVPIFSARPRPPDVSRRRR